MVLRRLFLLYFCLIPLYLLSQEDPYQELADKMFTEQEPLDVTLTTNFKEFRSEKFEEEYQPALISFRLNQGTLEDTIRIRARGNFRRRTCYNPPMRLNFKESAFTPKDTTSFLDKIKLVSVCRSSPAYMDYLLKEYAVYKMYELVSDFSFRTRLFNMTFIDSNKDKMKETETYAFIIEDIANLGYRTNSIEVEIKGIGESGVDQEKVIDMEVFQFLIGNTDWSIPGVHNVKFLKERDPSVYTPIVVPYDFDYSGMVNASYAVPSEKLGIEKVTDRVYRGQCRAKEEYERSFTRMQELKPQFLDIVDSMPGLSKSARYEMRNYVNEFYTIIESKSLYARYFVNGCRK